MKTSFKKLAAFGLLGAIAGCGDSGIEPGSRLNIVKGHIVFADKKVNVELANNGVVQFHPKSGESNGQKIWGSINEGSFFILTEEAGEMIPGAPVGDYVVTISSPVAVTPPQPKNGERRQSARQPVSVPQVIPKKYSDPKTTNLTVHVDEGDNEMPVIELKP